MGTGARRGDGAPEFPGRARGGGRDGRVARKISRASGRYRESRRFRNPRYSGTAHGRLIPDDSVRRSAIRIVSSCSSLVLSRTTQRSLCAPLINPFMKEARSQTAVTPAVLVVSLTVAQASV